MIIMEVCGVKCRKWVRALLFLISAAVFLVAAGSGRAAAENTDENSSSAELKLLQ